MKKDLCLCIHGHFYQPPRENPWLEEIEIQETAAPFHDWNEKIHHECYLPNALARVLDEKGHVLNIINNFQMMSFNLGPTLLAWLEKKFPETYRHILAADTSSLEKHGGHGNALGQVYNHMILPLATRRDKITQVKWGIYDFKHRFGRDPESIWLPETAVNEETLEVLIEEGIKFIILEPHQAEAVRPLDSDHWTDVSRGTIDPKMPYRLFLKSDPAKFIDIFFYDGPISKDAGFGDLAFDSKKFADRLYEAAVEEYHGSQLIHIASDGETYGHHKPFGDRSLAFLLALEAPGRGFRIVNYGEFLKENPPRYVVRLKEGEHHEGTSWSCPHGVKRWKDHCGCRGMGPNTWNQHWRKPLRQALNWLADELARIYETYGAHFLRDLWGARNDYISVILNRSEKNIQDFFSRHATKSLSKEEITFYLKLLEMQRNAMLMFTSCGWFFSELSGIETVQILEYAARAIQLAKEVTQKSMEEDFLKRLSEAKSNLPEFKDGRGVYEKLVKPRVASLHHAVGYYAICSTFDDYFPDRENLSLYCFKLHLIHQRKESFGNLNLNFGRVRITSAVTLEESDLVFIAVQIGLYDFRASVKVFHDPAELDKMEKELFEGLYSLHIVELLRKIDDYFGETYYALKDLPLAERTRVISILTKETVEKISDVYENLYEENRIMNEVYRSINVPIPAQIRFAAENTLARRLNVAVTRLAGQGFNPKKAIPVYRIIEIAKSFHAELKTEEVAAFLSLELEKRTKDLMNGLKPELISECLNIPKVAKKIGVELNVRYSQDHLLSLLRKWREHPEHSSAVASREMVNSVFELAKSIQINPKEFKGSSLEA